MDEHQFPENLSHESQSHIPVTLNISGNFTSHTQHTHELLLDHLDSGLALLQITDPSSYAQSPSKAKHLSFQWCNRAFEAMFQTKASIFNLDQQIFLRVGQPTVPWSLCDMIADVHWQFTSEGRVSNVSAVMKRLFHVVKETAPLSSASVLSQGSSFNLLNMTLIKIKEVFERGTFYFYVYMEDLSEWIAVGNRKLQMVFQTTLVNGLCYDKISRLEQMIAISGELIDKLRSAHPRNSVEGSSADHDSLALQTQMGSLISGSYLRDESTMEYRVLIVWSHLQLMQMFTNSQIDLFLLKKKRLTLNISERHEISLTKFVHATLKPFRVLLRERALSFEVIEPNEKVRANFNTMRFLLCTDWGVYTHVLYHLVTNAIKISKHGNRIKVVVEVFAVLNDPKVVQALKPADEEALRDFNSQSSQVRQQKYTYFLQTSVVNFGEEFFNACGASATFYNNSDSPQASTGIHLSTASSLVTALGSKLQVKTQKSGKSHTSNTSFKIHLIKKSHADVFRKELQCQYC